MLEKIGFGGIEQSVIQTLILNHPDAKPVTLEQLKRLKPSQEDQEEIVKKRFNNFKATGSMLEDVFGNKVKIVDVSEKSIGEVSRSLYEMIEALYA